MASAWSTSKRLHPFGRRSTDACWPGISASIVSRQPSMIPGYFLSSVILRRQTRRSREIAQSFTPAAISNRTALNSSAERNWTPPHLGDAFKLEGTADKFVRSSSGTISTLRAWRNGIRAGFRCPCSKEREGSSPSARTLSVEALAQFRGYFEICSKPSICVCGHNFDLLRVSIWHAA